MVTGDAHGYEVAVTTMPRHKLEEFALRAATTLEQLEEENAELQMNLDDTKKVDPKVISGWREWCQIVDQEREKWAATATRLSEDIQEITASQEECIMASNHLMSALKEIAERAKEDSEEGSNSKAMRKGLTMIEQIASDAMEMHLSKQEQLAALPAPQDEIAHDES